MYRCILVFSIVILSGCSIAENKVSRDQLSSSVRQINSTFISYDDNKPAEENLNMLRMSDFYSDYTSQLGSIRNELAKVSMTKRFNDYYVLLEDVISESINFFNIRASLMSDMFEMSSKLERLSYDMNRYFEQKAVLDRVQKRFSFDIYANSEEYQENKAKVEKGISDIRIDNAQYVDDIDRYEDNKRRLDQLSDSINMLNNEVGIVDNLSFYDVVSDENDFINQLDTTNYSQYITDLVELLPEL